MLLFSATMGKEVESISRRYQHNPARYEIEAEASQADDVTHHFWRVPRTDRVKLTAQLVAQHGQAFVFCRTKRSADRVARQLGAAGVRSAPIHGDRSQHQRTRALAAFTSGQTHALVATDVVARGIHVDDVPCVVHFDPPGDAESYVHRSGRTGRAGNTGTVVCLVPDEQQGEVRALQRELGFPAELTAPFEEAPPAPPTISPDRRPAADEDRASRSSRPKNPERAARHEATASRLNGTVKFFDAKRGYGFLAAPDGSDVFVHHSKLRRPRAGTTLPPQGRPGRLRARRRSAWPGGPQRQGGARWLRDDRRRPGGEPEPDGQETTPSRRRRLAGGISSSRRSSWFCPSSCWASPSGSSGITGSDGSTSVWVPRSM